MLPVNRRDNIYSKYFFFKKYLINIFSIFPFSASLFFNLASVLSYALLIQDVKEKCKTASRVLFIQPSPLFDPEEEMFSPTGHLLLSVIDRK